MQLIGGTVDQSSANRRLKFDSTLRLNTDVRSITEIGVVRGFARLTGAYTNAPSTTPIVSNGSLYLNQGYVQFAGISAGLQESYFLGSNSTGATILTTDDGNSGNLTDYKDFRGGTTTSIGYSQSLVSGLSYGIALEDAEARHGRTAYESDPSSYTTFYAGPADYPDLVAKLSYVNGPITISVMGASHQNTGYTSGEAMGYAGQTNVKYTLSPETQLFAQAAYAYGAMSYLGVKDLILIDHADATLDSTIDMASGYNLLAGVIQKAVQGNIQLVGTYGVSSPWSGASTQEDTTVTQGEINYDWSPVKNLKVIPAFAYTRKDYNSVESNSGSFRLTIRRDF
jgi:hypothetical protein